MQVGASQQQRNNQIWFLCFRIELLDSRIGISYNNSTEEAWRQPAPRERLRVGKREVGGCSPRAEKKPRRVFIYGQSPICNLQNLDRNTPFGLVLAEN